MRTKEEFKIYYESKLLPLLKKLEKKRRENVLETFIRRLVRVVCFIGSFAIFMQIHWEEDANIGVGLIVGLALGYIIGVPLHHRVEKRKEAIRKAFKQEIIGDMVRFINSHLTYSDQKHIEVNEFTESNLFPMRPDNYSGDDLVHGVIGKTEIRFSEVHIKQQVQKGFDTEGNYSILRSIIANSFQGVFFVADFHKNFYGQTYVLPAKYSFPKKRLSAGAD